MQLFYKKVIHLNISGPNVFNKRKQTFNYSSLITERGAFLQQQKNNNKKRLLNQTINVKVKREFSEK